MRHRIISGLWLSLSALLLLSQRWSAQDASQLRDSSYLEHATRWRSLDCSLTADFDGDDKPDLAVGQEGDASYTVQVHFASETPKVLLTFPITGPGIRIQARDVDLDDDQDIVVTTALSDVPIAVWLGDGKGHFQPGDPWAYLPNSLKSSHQYEQGFPQDVSPGLTEESSPFTGMPPRDPAIVALKAGAWVQGPAGPLTPQYSFYSFIARGPPSSSPIA